ncbi:MFS general substrate transporter [Dendrothele bispora CBS 962.96]|uniref:MFS general substrate transporter n=1 Tax=Dendrothele bispora (strain CBS 962.96) TaxID=1314807 RepID=A0A4S8MJ15_DENBC|nr:MFS general substrate transporter [Dendrothele bispora CBS 962.96]
MATLNPSSTVNSLPSPTLGLGLTRSVQPSREKAESVHTLSGHSYPEGGLEAWLVVFGSFLSLFATWGIINSYGVFHDYYSNVLLAQSSSSTIALIGALQLFLLYGCGPVVGRVFDLYGSKLLVPLGSIVTVVSLLLLSFCQPNETYQFFLADGLLFGVGSAIVFVPSIDVLGHWFNRQRPLAIGIVASGSSLGGVVYPILLERLIPKVGFPWAVRIMAFINLGCLALSCVTIKDRPTKRGRIWQEGIVDLTGFRDVKYCLACVATFILFYAQFIPYFYIQAYASYRQLPPMVSQYILAMMNAAGIIRILPSILAVHYGTLNVIIPSTLISGILVLGLWLPSKGVVPLVIFALSYGILSGVFIALLSAYIGSISPPERFGARLGCVWFFAAIACLVGTPTGGAFLQDRQNPNYGSLILFTGLMIIGGAIVLIIARVLHSRSWTYKI